MNALYNTAQIGDIVIVPGPGRTFIRSGGEDAPGRPTLIGEILSPPEQQRLRGERYNDIPLVVRRVRWLGEVDERDLSDRALRALRTKNALVVLQATGLQDILGAAYKNVVIGDQYLARFLTKNYDFSARESYHFQAFVMLVVAAYREHYGDAAADALMGSVFDIAARVEKSGDHCVPEQDASIHSPGYTTLKTIQSVPLIISVLFAMALKAEAEPITKDGVVNVQLRNSESEAYDPCAPDGLQDQVMQTLSTIGYDRWRQICPSARKAASEDGFESTAKVLEGDGQ